MGCCKATLVFTNILFLAAGITLIALGAYSYQSGTVKELNGVTVAIGLIVLGSFTTLVSFLGCCGGARESKAMLSVYFFVLLLIVLALVGVGIGAFKYRGGLESDLDKGWHKLDNATKASLQEDFKCCGWDGPSDAPAYDDPAACPTQVGCRSGIESFLKKRLRIVGIVGIVVGVFLVFGLVVSLCLVCTIPSDKQKREALLAEARRANAYGASDGSHHSGHHRQYY